MKKIISLLLALIMVFSVATVAFAEDADAPATDDTTTNAPVDGEGEEDAEDSILGEYDWLLDMPFWTAKSAFKLAKIAVKFVKIYFKLGIIFGFIDGEEVMNQVIGAIEDLIASSQQPEADAPAVEDTAPAAA